MSSKRRTETKRGNLTPIIVGSVVAIVIIFFIAVFALQPSAEKNFFGGEINVEGDSLPSLSLDFNRDCALFENFNYCQQEVKTIQKWINENGNPDPIKIYAVLTSINSSQPNYPPDKWLESENWSLPTFIDNDQDGVAKHFGIRGFPFWVIVDHHGKIITRLSGSYTEEQFEIILANTLQHDKKN